MEISSITGQAGVVGAKRRRIGRGIGSYGKTSGRGHKGQSSRSGAKDYALKEGGQMPFFRKVAKRGFNSRKLGLAKLVAVVDVAKIDSVVAGGGLVDIELLREMGFVSSDAVSIRVVGCGVVTKPYNVVASHVSRAASMSIEKAGGTVVLE